MCRKYQNPLVETCTMAGDMSTSHMGLVWIVRNVEETPIATVPCQNSLAVIGKKGEQPYSFCSHYNTSTYIGDIVPLGDRKSECFKRMDVVMRSSTYVEEAT